MKNVAEMLKAVAPSWRRRFCAWLLPCVLCGGAAIWAGETTVSTLSIPAWGPPLETWGIRSGNPAFATTDGDSALLQATAGVESVSSANLTVGKEIAKDKSYALEYDLSLSRLEAGIFRIYIECLSAEGKAFDKLGCYTHAARFPEQKRHPMRFLFGAGTAHPLPEATASCRITIGFFSSEAPGNATARIAKMRLSETFLPGGSTWPPVVKAKIGDLEFSFNRKTAWNLCSISFQGNELCDANAGYFGSVFKFKELGFAGSGHFENGIGEELQTLALVVDGQEVPLPKAELAGKALTLTKTSVIRHIRFESTLHVEDNRIDMRSRICADKPEEMDLLYHFMLPFSAKMTDYLVVNKKGEEISGTFRGDNGFPYVKPASLVALHDRENGISALARLTSASPASGAIVRLWDTKERYKKFYLQEFTKQTIMAEQPHVSTLTLIPFVAKDGEPWIALAKRLGITDTNK